MKFKIFFFLVFLAGFLHGRPLRILIEDSAKAVNLSSASDMVLTEVNGKRKILPRGNSFPVLPRSGGLDIRGTGFASPVRVSSKEILRLNGRSYRGDLLIENYDGKIRVINEVLLEDYLCGVLPCEVSPSWNKEVLKAQAVVSRTYAVKNIKENSPYDLCATEFSQVYKGAGVETPSTNAAVKETEGEVIFYGNEIADVYFHADAAGYTESPENVWSGKSAPRYLSGVREPRLPATPHSEWRCEISYEKIEEILEKNKIHIGSLKRIKLAQKNRSGRWEKIIFYGREGKAEVPFSKFRLWVGSSCLKSTKIKSFRLSGRSVVFEGSGWGHGIGLSQWGAKSLADEGWDYRKILRFYFPSTHIKKLS